MTNTAKGTTDNDESSASERTREEIEEETGGVVYTEHGRRYRMQVISNSGDPDEPTSV